MNSNIIIAQITRLVLLQDAHRARKRHGPVSGVMDRLRAATTAVAAAEGRHG